MVLEVKCEPEFYSTVFSSFLINRYTKDDIKYSKKAALYNSGCQFSPTQPIEKSTQTFALFLIKK